MSVQIGVSPRDVSRGLASISNDRIDNAAGNHRPRDIAFPAGENPIRRTRRESLHHYVDCQPDNIDSEMQVDVLP